MSDSQKPPRVCWVYPEVFYKEEWRKQNRYDEMVYMIEHSAYQSAIERIERLEKKLEIAKSALEHIQGDDDCDDCIMSSGVHEAELAAIATQAIEQFDEFMKDKK